MGYWQRSILGIKALENISIMLYNYIYIINARLTLIKFFTKNEPGRVLEISLFNKHNSRAKNPVNTE